MRATFVFFASFFSFWIGHAMAGHEAEKICDQQGKVPAGFSLKTESASGLICFEIKKLNSNDGGGTVCIHQE